MDYIITSDADKAIEQFKNTVFVSTKDKEYQKMFFTLPKTVQRQLVYNIVRAQAETLDENIKAYRSTTLVGFGTFKYREGKRRAWIMRDRLAQKNGYLTYGEITDKDIYESIGKEVDSIKTKVLIDEHIDKVKSGRSFKEAKVFTSFRK